MPLKTQKPERYDFKDSLIILLFAHVSHLDFGVCILLRSALCTSDGDSGKISRRAHFTDCHEICTEFVFCGYFEHARNTQLVKVLYLAANTVTHIIHNYTYDSLSDVGEIRVYQRADFQSCSRVLKKVF